jgi:transposase
MDDLERDRSFLTSNEKKMIVRVHQYFLSIRQRQTQRQDLSLRKEVASVLGIGEATVARVVAEYNGSENEEFSQQTIQGRPKKGLDHNVVELVHKFVMSANVSGSPLSTHTLRQKLEENNHILSKWQLLRVLHMLGYYYGRGERRNMLHESLGNVAFRSCYLRHRSSS